MKIDDYDLPDDYLYDENYGWAKIEGDVATIGVTHFGLEQTKEIAYVELPKVGDKFDKGADYSVMEAAKWAGQLKMPLSGEVTEVNDTLLDDPGLLNSDPYGKGWIVKIKLTKPEETKQLMDVKKAAEFYIQKKERR